MAAIPQKVCELKYPVTVSRPLTSPSGKPIAAGTVISSILLQRFKAKHLRMAGDSSEKGMAGTLRLIGVLNDYPMEIMDEIDGADILAIMEDIVPFLDGLPGANQS